MKEKQWQEGTGEPPRRFALSTLVCTAILAALAGLVLTVLVGARVLGGEGVSLLQAALLVKTQFVGEYDLEEVTDAALGGMVTALDDRWSYYLDEENYQRVTQTRTNAFVGIGVTILEENEGDICILSVTPGSPAEEGGLLPGEYIRGVEGVTVTAENSADCIDAISGPEGTALTLEIEGTDGSLRTVELTRATVHTVAVTGRLLADGTGLVRIENFYSGSGDALEEEVTALQEQGAMRLVFDVRSNPGGYVTELTQILDFLLPEGPIFIQEDVGGGEEVYTSDAAFVDLPLGVLVNEDSYSAAELFAAQLRETAGAVVAGAQTSGKGYAQQLFPLANGGGLGISTSRYFTGGRVSLIGEGLHPDPLVAMPEEEIEDFLLGRLDPAADTQLAALLAALDEGAA